MNEGYIKNMGFVRHCAALSVIFSHSFLIAEGSEDNEPIQSATGEILGIYGVFTFFIISGYLITKSCLNSSSSRNYLWKRFLRIYPAYLVSVVVCLLVLGPLFLNESTGGMIYLKEAMASMVRASLFFDNVLMVEGVSLYDGEKGSVLNGVYWTIKVEVMMYLLILFLYKTKLLNPLMAVLFSLGVTICFLYDWYPKFDLLGVYFGIPGFFAGSFLYLFMRQRRYRASISLVFIGLIVLASYFGYIHKLFPILAAYPIISLGYVKVGNLDKVFRHADYSYGIYVFGWPIQQLVRVWCGPSLSGWSFFLITTPLVVAVSWLSWNYIEKPCLRMKSRWR